MRPRVLTDDEIKRALDWRTAGKATRWIERELKIKRGRLAKILAGRGYAQSLRTVSTADLIIAAEAYTASGGDPAVAAAGIGIEPESMRLRLNLAAKRGLLGFSPVLPGFEISRTSEWTGPDGQSRTSVTQRQEHGPIPEIPPDFAVERATVHTGPDGRLVQRWDKLRERTIVDFVESIQRVFSEYEWAAPKVARPKALNNDLCSAYVLTDLHCSMLSWGAETGSDYDSKIARELALETLMDLVERAPASALGILLNLGDFFHTDDSTNATPASKHTLDVDTRHHRTLDNGIRLGIDLIEFLRRKHDRIIVRSIPGNHDPHATIALTMALKYRYERDDRVVVDDTPGPFWYFRFGQNLIGAHHGDRVKPADLVCAMADRRRQDWGETAYHHFFSGHIHHEKANEVAGCRWEAFETIAARDAHANKQAYSAGRSLTSITYHRERGETGRHRVNIPPPTIRALAAS